jgi:hypothetical protein
MRNSTLMRLSLFGSSSAGSITGLQAAILQGKDAIARDIIDSTFQEDLNEKYGVRHFVSNEFSDNDRIRNFPMCYPSG